jgi:hypothetical protein
MGESSNRKLQEENTDYRVQEVARLNGKLDIIMAFQMLENEKKTLLISNAKK